MDLDGHDITGDTSIPGVFRLTCSCGEWDTSEPIHVLPLAGMQRLADAGLEHIMAVIRSRQD